MLGNGGAAGGGAAAAKAKATSGNANKALENMHPPGHGRLVKPRF